jgi:hypothetical protein
MQKKRPRNGGMQFWDIWKPGSTTEKLYDLLLENCEKIWQLDLTEGQKAAAAVFWQLLAVLWQLFLSSWALAAA